MSQAYKIHKQMRQVRGGITCYAQRGQEGRRRVSLI